MENSVAKEFKDYDVKFAKFKRTDDMESKEDQEMAKLIKVWGVPVERWIMTDIRQAVYDVEDAEEWQKFRVSLKGQSTGMKLFRLSIYWAEAREKYRVGSPALTIFKIRVDNYIGALVRGGQLSTSYVVQK